MHYTKPALTFDEQLGLLRQRGLVIPDADRATRWLQKARTPTGRSVTPNLPTSPLASSMAGSWTN
jgi:hypothetical protein